MKKIIIFIMLFKNLTTLAQVVRFNKTYNLFDNNNSTDIILNNKNEIVSCVATIKNNCDTFFNSLTFFNTSGVNTANNFVGIKVNSTYPYSLLQSSDSNYYITSVYDYSDTFSNNITPVNATMLTKFDKNGHLLWYKHWGDDTNSIIRATNISTINGNGVLLSGYRMYAGYYKNYMCKLDSAGSIHWEHTWFGGGTSGEIINSHFIDNGYIYSGGERHNGQNWNATYFIGGGIIYKYDTNGTILQQKYLPNYKCQSLLLNKNIDNNRLDKFIAFCTIDSSYSNADSTFGFDLEHKPVFLGLDSNFNIVWKKEYLHFTESPWQEDNTIPLKCKNFEDGKVLMCGMIALNYGITVNGWAMMLDNRGNLLWEHTYDYPARPLSSQQLTGIAKDTNGAYYLCGAVGNDTLKPSAWLLKLDSNGCADTSICFPMALPTVPVATTVMQLYPNPTHNSINIALPNTLFTSNTWVATLAVYNTLGQQLYSSTLYSPQTTIDVGTYPNGLYYVQVFCNGKSTTQKFIKN